FFDMHRTWLVVAGVAPSILHSGRVKGCFPALFYPSVRAQALRIIHSERRNARVWLSLP
ncbi:hypothetical protein PAXRUDRAFT_158984, partial [Paxillus rubicundulus Ve08.2h10]